VNPATNKIYVPNGISGTVTVINGSDESVAATINTGGSPRIMGVNPNTNRIYVPTQLNVKVIDGSSDNVVATVSAGLLPMH